jgi:hypothetical protein
LPHSPDFSGWGFDFLPRPEVDFLFVDRSFSRDITNTNNEGLHPEESPSAIAPAKVARSKML